MESDILINKAKFAVGHKVKHELLGYRGIVLDVDAAFSHSDEWYEKTDDSRPTKEQPWYQILVHDSDSMTYVAEQNLTVDYSGEAIDHPVVPLCFDRDENGGYQRRVNLQ